MNQDYRFQIFFQIKEHYPIQIHQCSWYKAELLAIQNWSWKSSSCKMFTIDYFVKNSKIVLQMIRLLF